MGKANLTIHEVAHVVELMVPSFPGNTYGPLFFQTPDTMKIEALRLAKVLLRQRFNYLFMSKVICNDDFHFQGSHTGAGAVN